ncbi:vacuolar protein [Ceratobasidium sp. AG-Ba]|nr:vacuolar protein [Ceratobasidium sp. AG-Ba]
MDTILQGQRHKYTTSGWNNHHLFQMLLLALGGLFVATGALACPGHEHDDHAHVRRMQPSATPSSDWPTVPLVWGDVNVVHTTDTHGWLLGHLHASQPEPNYSGDLGDLASFVSRLKANAAKKKVDLLLVDSGDLHNGNGLSEGHPTGSVDGHVSSEFLSKLPYDVMTIGKRVALDMHQNLAPRLNGRYLTSNVNITVADKSGNNANVPIGERFIKFQTKQGRKVTAFGVLYGFTGNVANTTVQKPEAMVNESWFKEAIQEEPDFFLLNGHMPVNNDKWPTVVGAIRAVHPSTPVLVFGGHTHIRDCVQYDNRSMALESGQYMETVGWLSANLTKAKNNTNPIEFSRRYLDANRNTYQFHTGQKAFDTPDGKKITKDMSSVAKKWNLTQVWGNTPQDYYLHRVQYPDDSSLISLLANQVIPAALNDANPARANISRMLVLDTGSQRYDVFAGPFTMNDQFIACPYTNIFQYIPGVPAGDCMKVTDRLNGITTTKRSQQEEEEEEYRRGEFRYRYSKWKREQYENYHFSERDAQLTLGYVTTDSCPGVGDDIPHTPMAHYDPPKYVTPPPDPSITPATPVDCVFFDFYASKVITNLNVVSTNRTYSAGDVVGWGPTGPFYSNQMYEAFVKKTWGVGGTNREDFPPYPVELLLSSLYGI